MDILSRPTFRVVQGSKCGSSSGHQRALGHGLPHQKNAETPTENEVKSKLVKSWKIKRSGSTWIHWRSKRRQKAKMPIF